MEIPPAGMEQGYQLASLWRGMSLQIYMLPQRFQQRLPPGRHQVCRQDPEFETPGLIDEPGRGTVGFGFLQEAPWGILSLRHLRSNALLDAAVEILGALHHSGSEGAMHEALSHLQRQCRLSDRTKIHCFLRTRCRHYPDTMGCTRSLMAQSRYAQPSNVRRVLMCMPF